MSALLALYRFVDTAKDYRSSIDWVLDVGLVTSYKLGDVFAIGMFLMLSVSFLCWLLSVIMQNHSQVDRIWSIIPFVYCWHFFFHAYLTTGTVNTRLLVMAVLTTLWGLRLTYNFYRKGGYNLKDEDYRWPALRKIINNRFIFELFNISFIALYQNMLLYMITLPMYYAYLGMNIPWNTWDYIAAISFIFFLLLETVADQQQWNYQTKKYELINGKKKLYGIYKVGFAHTGLFRFSRHPNFFGEMSIWWSFYIFSVSFGGTVNQTIIGTILLTLLFQGSTKFTESITEVKYPDFKIYKKHTSRFIPLPASDWQSKNK